MGPIVKWGLRAATGTAVYGVYMFNTNDIGTSISRRRCDAVLMACSTGLCELIARVWHA